MADNSADRGDEFWGESSPVSSNNFFGDGFPFEAMDFVECPALDRRIEAELFPPIPTPLKVETLDVLRTWPANWTPLDRKSCSAVREQALQLLARRGLLEAQVHDKNDTGQDVIVKLSGSIAEEMTADGWQTAEFRLSAQGTYARAFLDQGDTDSVVGWIFYDRLHGKAESVFEVQPEALDHSSVEVAAREAGISVQEYANREAEKVIRRELKLKGIAVPQPVEQNESAAWHEADATPPSEYTAGPLTGTKGQLVKWILRNKDHRLLETALNRGTYWGREDSRTQCSVWFKKHERYAEANSHRLADQK